MSVRTAPLRTAIRAVDEQQAQLQTRLIATLNRRRLPEFETSARVASERDRRAASAWIQFTAGHQTLSVAPLLVDGQLARIATAQGRPDAPGAAAALAQIEPLVAALELVIGRELHPAGLQSHHEDPAVMLRLDASVAEGPIRHRLLLAVPPDLALEPLTLPEVVPTTLARLRLRWVARLPAPSLAPNRLAAMGRGDLLLLGAGALVARVSLPGRNAWPRARVTLLEGVMVLQDDPAEQDTDQTHIPAPSPDAAPAGASLDWNGVTVPLTVEFSGGNLTAAELATLGKGSVLPLAATGGTLAVRLVAGEQVVADGELVAVGQGFGVLITGVATDKAD